MPVAPRSGAAESRDSAACELTQALSASLIAFAVGAVFLSLAYSEILFTLLALSVAIQKVTPRATPREGARP